jgi:1-acyl-sn-glycerol-3-phosphate acyltransferase
MKFKKLIKGLVAFYYRTFFKLRVSGEENIPRSGGFVLCPNHFSNHDPFVIGSIGPITQHFMAKSEIFKNPLIGFLVKSLDGFPVERDGNDLSALKKSIKILKNNESLLIFAEGHRNKGNKKVPLEVKPGIALIALKGKASIIPVTIDSTYRLFSEIRVIYHKPLELEYYKETKPTNEDYQKISEEAINIAYSGVKNR